MINKLVIYFFILVSSSAYGETKEEPEEDNDSQQFTCGSKYYCKDMSSCAEARFYLTQCGLSRLDRDDDSIPCESICL